MSRLYSRNSRGRQPVLASTPRFSRSKEHPNETYQQQHDRKHKPGRRYAITTPSVSKKRRIASPASEEDLSSSPGSETADDASDEESEEDDHDDGDDEDDDDHNANANDDDDDDEDDKPPFVTPPARLHRRAEGRPRKKRWTDGISLAGSIESMFGDYQHCYDDDDDPNLSPEENRKRFEDKIFAESDDDNDDIYQAVDDISDSDDADDEDIERLEEQQLLALLSEDENDGPEFYLNQIDGLSAYGFGDDSDASVQPFLSSQGSDSATETGTEKRVRFAGLDRDHSIFLRLSQSPTITRALLPSALPDLFDALPGPMRPSDAARPYSPLADPDDSDLTDDCLPEQAHLGPPATPHRESERSPSVSPPSKKSSKKTPRRRGPPRGIFIDEGDKTSGILDSTGKIILMTNPHLLGEEFARRYGASQTSSPDVGFAELIDESDTGGEPGGATDGMAPGTDIMLASLNSALNDPAYRGQATGPLEAFYPADSIVIGDYAFDPDELEENFQPDRELGEDVINLEDVIKFDDDSDDESDAALLPTSPLFMQSNREVSAVSNINHHFSHLTNINVTAFRRNADPSFAALSNVPSFRDLDLLSASMATPSPRRKRKSHHASPYTSSHYQGVTPVQRMTDPNQARTPDSTGPSKRRRIMT